MTDKEYFKNICPYNDKKCVNKWNCLNCEIETEEREIMELLEMEEENELLTTSETSGADQDKETHSGGNMANFKEIIKDNKPKFTQRVLFYLYRLRHNKYYACHFWNLCGHCEYINICYDEREQTRRAGKRTKPNNKPQENPNG